MRLWIFDWDGTLIDSLDKIVYCMQLSIADLGLPRRTDSQLRGIIGLSMPVAADTLFPGITKEQLTQLIAAYKTHFKMADHYPCKLYAGVVDGLERLRSRGDKLAIATGKSRSGLDAVLSSLDWLDYFDVTRCADETRSKPHPLMLHEIIGEVGVAKEKVVMVGDTEYDLKMAANAGVKSVALTYGAHDEKRLKACAPVICVNSFAELLCWAE